MSNSDMLGVLAATGTLLAVGLLFRPFRARTWQLMIDVWNGLRGRS